MNNHKELFTIGHSNHNSEAFIQLLKQHEVTAIADVRSHPYSRQNPQFTQAALKASLVEVGIYYVFLGKELGARSSNPNCYVDGKALYERIAATEEFAIGVQRLLKGAQKHRIALMCAEKDPMTCHRAILVCQNLRHHDIKINHILSNGTLLTQQQLESRLLQKFGLAYEQVNQPVQLSLFTENNSVETPMPNSDLEDRLKIAYHQQSQEIAYQEKKYDPSN